MGKKDDQELTTKEAANTKIDAIKQLIFGDNMAEYSQEFDTLKKEIEKSKEELTAYIEDTRKDLMTAIDNLSTDVNIRISDLEESMNDRTDALDNKKVDKAQLGDLLIALGENIKG